MHEATLLTGDLDFQPLIDALVREGMIVSLWYPPGFTARELIASADRGRPFDVGDVYSALKHKNFTIPQAHSEPSKGEYAEVLKRWSADGIEAKLMKDGRTFVVEVRPDPYSTMVTYYQHEDVAILRAYLFDTRDLMLPEISGAG